MFEMPNFKKRLLNYSIIVLIFMNDFYKKGIEHSVTFLLETSNFIINLKNSESQTQLNNLQSYSSIIYCSKFMNDELKSFMSIMNINY